MARRVKTAEGARRFGVPIGSLIGEGPEEPGSAEGGAVVKKKRVRPLVGTQTTDQQKASPTAEQPKSTKTGPTVTDLPNAPKNPSKFEEDKRWGEQDSGVSDLITFRTDTRGPGQADDGPLKLNVGDLQFGLPEGSTIKPSPFNNDIKYVSTPDGSFRVYTKRGEIELNNVMVARLTRLLMDSIGVEENGSTESTDPSGG